MPVDVDALADSLRQFVRSHNAEFQRLSTRKSQLLEVGAMMISAKHYELAGYTVTLKNPAGWRDIRVKLGTRGDPWNFSRFEVEHDGLGFEIHTNLPVIDALDTPGARYVVDVAVTRGGTVPAARPSRGKWLALRNRDLVIFLEAKALVIYPMLIAQFIGIVHEIKPIFLGGRPRNFVVRGHFDPALVSLGHLHGTCLNIVRGFEGRGCRIGIVPEFDRAITRLKFGGVASPLSQTEQAAALSS